MNIEKLLAENNYNFHNKTIAITGSTGGIFSNVTECLVRLGANLILINRNPEKTQKQIDYLKNINPNCEIEFVQCDLVDMKSVKSATDILKQKHIDILFLASGIYNVPRFKTDIGYDNVFQTNFLSHYFLVRELLETIKTSNGKIIAVGSIAYKYSKIDIQDIDFTDEKKASKVYGNSKRFLMFTLHELCKSKGINLTLVHPGITLTNMTNHYPKWINWLVKINIKLLFTRMQNSVLCMLEAASHNTPFEHWIGPSKFNIWGKPKINLIKDFPQSERSYAFNVAEKLYEKIR